MLLIEEDLNSLGDSRKVAEKRLEQNVRKLGKNPTMQKRYNDFLEEYENLYHMEKMNNENLSAINYYMPHHGVFKPDSTSTKLRVIFNASSPTTTGKRLNDVLLSGEIIEDIFNIMLRFRKQQIVLIADIRQMFRQILIDPSQRDLLRILWKTKEEEEPVGYGLKPVTYGTK
ncbi:hypothetical protein AVEN_79999-1 [Araneus ventricosus]|uniref:Reverse transcriptase domain-containing protein n=1 Tax=Araneus ventricosus TaxID=182803 RepID=A0A4Y2FQ76_ARAVE|nr:hypothetical protein AVEN_79999-1 [Araneus ventricosus]